MVDNGFFFLVESKDSGTPSVPTVVSVLSGTDPKIWIRGLLGLSRRTSICFKGY